MANEQPIFVEFYNLHLENCFTIVPREELGSPQWKAKVWVRRWSEGGNDFELTRQEDGKGVVFPVFPEPKWAKTLAIKEIRLPTEETKDKITKFCRRHFFNVFSDYNMPRNRICNMLEGYPIYMSKSINDWVNSEGFLDFMLDYYCFRKLIDEYLIGQFRVWTLEWFREYLHQFRYDLEIYRGNESINSLIFIDIIDFDEELSINSLKFNRQGSYIDKTPYKMPYGWLLGYLLSYIYPQVEELLEDRTELKRCQAPKTQRTLKCQNIFIPQKRGKKQEYCSIKCGNRTRRHKYYWETGE